MPLLQSISKFVFIIVNFDVLELFLYFIYVYSCHVMSHRVTSCHIMSYHVTSCQYIYIYIYIYIFIYQYKTTLKHQN